VITVPGGAVNRQQFTVTSPAVIVSVYVPDVPAISPLSPAETTAGEPEAKSATSPRARANDGANLRIASSPVDGVHLLAS
jgi:hypothetical protein